MLEPKRLRTPLSGWGVGGPLGLAATDGRPEPPTGNRRFWGSGRPGRPGNLTKRWGGEAPQIGPKGRPIGPVCKYCAPGGEGGGGRRAAKILPKSDGSPPLSHLRKQVWEVWGVLAAPRGCP